MPNPRLSPSPSPSLNLTLLHSGRDYFPALLAAINAAQHSIRLETYNFANDPTGRAVRDALLAARRRGVDVHVTVDGFGSGDDGRSVVALLAAAGIHAHIYRPKRWWQAGLSPKLLRRLHRKLSVFDDTIAFVGGINVLDDHNHTPHTDSTLGPRFDFAVRCSSRAEGSSALGAGASQRDASDVVGQIARAMKRPGSKPPTLRTQWGKPAALVQRDNLHNRRSIEKMYLKLLASAKQEVWLANAYFVPGRKLRRALLDCRRRGVAVNLLLQGRQEYLLQHHATQALYGQLLSAGVTIYEYTASFLHAKVASIDGLHATVGSSNIDPFSLMLAREANLLVNDASFATELQTALQTAAHQAAQLVNPQAPRPVWQRGLDWAAYGLIRLGQAVAVGRL
jgi:cardiolipin synthase A/B